MATPLETAAQRRGIAYREERLTQMGGWDADATDATLAADAFSEIRNFRRATTGEYEMRSGCSTTVLTGTNAATLLAKCEYRNTYLGNDTFFDVSLFVNSTSVYLTVYDPVTGFQTSPVTIPTAANAESWVVQYGYSLIVTVKGAGTWEAYPDNGSNFTTWTVRSLGKDLGPTPTRIGFVGKTQGDLFAIDNTGTSHGTGAKFADHIKYDPNQPGEPLLIPLIVNADYWCVEPYYSLLGGSTQDFAVNDPPRYVFAKQDAGTSSFPASSKYGYAHNCTRAWGYKFVAVQEFTDSKGDKYRVRSAPSADFWVADMMYAPAQLGPFGGVSPLSNSSGSRNWLPYNGSTIKYNYPQAQEFFGSATKFIPSPEDFWELQKKIIKLLTPTVDANYIDGNPGTVAEPPYLWLAEYFGYNAPGNNGDFGGKPPFLAAIPASQLKGAPMTVFTWSQFNTSGLLNTSSLIEIEIYRTAHSEPDDKDNTTKDPNFEVRKYGYVGSLMAPVSTEAITFTDDIVDDAIDFGTTPEQQDGYLRGQFSGSVMRDFDNRLVIGDVVTDYKVLKPVVFQVAGQDSQFYPISFDCTTSAFMLRVDETKVTTSYDYTAFTGSALPLHFGVAYVDSNGIQSDMTDIGPPMQTGFTPGDFGEPISPRKFWISINLPRGYAANVTTVRIFRGWLNSGGTYDWTPTGANPTAGVIATMKVDAGQGNYLSKNDETAVAGSIVGTVKRSTSPGSIIFSQPNQIYFWPPLNFEVHHLFAPVRMLEVVLGPLFVGTDQSISLTYLDGHREELTKLLGPISRFAVQKVDKIVFFLSAYGMYFVESSGVVQFPAQVQSAILPYINETIATQQPLTTARRASLGFLGERNELWLHIPSSFGVLGTLPHRTMLFKLGAGNDPRRPVNYEFDLTENFERADIIPPIPGNVPGVLNLTVDDTSRWRSEHVIFSSKATGGLFAGFYDDISAYGGTPNNAIVTIDCDVPAKTWTGTGVMEKSWHMGVADVKKALRELIIRTQGSSKITLTTGQAANDDVVTHTFGHINPAARRFEVIDPLPPLRHIVAGQTLESVSTAPYTRVWAEPDDVGNNNVSIKSIGVMATLLNNHP